MINAAMIPGTQPQSHSRNTIKIEPHPLSKTAKGGQIMDNNTLKKFIFFDLILIDDEIHLI